MISRVTAFNSQFYLPMYFPRKRPIRLRFKLRERPSAKAWMRMSFRSKPRRFNPWVYNNSPYVWNPKRKS